ncbi:hypothetical protein L1049_024130 [Liquidambar formosana]|uniref:Uncharacterized protein n=1 Tax=Liquidambar formosana TaxID=63359 RepID=A0AAP0X4B1_LIQFO
MHKKEKVEMKKISKSSERSRKRDYCAHTILQGNRRSVAAEGSLVKEDSSGEGSPVGTLALGTLLEGTPPLADNLLLIKRQKSKPKPIDTKQKLKEMVKREMITLWRRYANRRLLLSVVAHFSLFTKNNLV